MKKLIRVYTDGASRGNGSQAAKAAIAVRILDEKGWELERYAKCIGSATNNQAEYLALVTGLEKGTKHTKRRIDCYCDSQLVVNQMNSKWRVNAKLRPFWIKAAGFEEDFEKVTYNHLPRTHPEIQKVDELVNQALDEDEPSYR